MLRQTSLLVLAFVLALPPGLQAVEEATPVPYTATYKGSYWGFGMGRLQYILHSPEPGRFIFSSHADPGLLARLFVTDDAVERSVMQIDEKGVRPLIWSREDGKSGEEEDGNLTFDWEAERVRGTVEEDPVDLPTEPNLQDPLSLQIAVQTALLRGREPGTIPMLGDDRVKHYRYVSEGEQRIETAAGSFDTVVYSASREGSDRTARVWYAPTLGFMPVRAEQQRDGRVEMVLELTRIDSMPSSGSRLEEQ